MNLKRRLSRHQKSLLMGVARGQFVVFYEEGQLKAREHYLAAGGSDGSHVCWIPDSKPRGRELRGRMCGNHFNSSVVELLQRGLLVREGDVVYLSREARRSFGVPPPPDLPKRAVAMWRTRAARDQTVEGT